jgi:hypothetical protein
VFLGFAFHPEAMELLKPAEPLPNPSPVFATGLGMSNEDATLVGGQIGRVMFRGSGWPTVRNDLTCAQLFDSYTRSIAG